MDDSQLSIKNRKPKRLIIVSTICSLNIALIFFYYHIDKLLTGPLYHFLTIMIPATLIAIAVFFCTGFADIIRNRNSLTWLMFLPAAVSLLTIIYVFNWSYKFSSETWESKAVLKGCFEGTQNQAT